MEKKNTVFISYAREDAARAERLYMDLRKANIDAWLDTKNLLPGQNWKREITKAIKNSAYFLALISERSVNKRGVVQKELKQALNVLEEVPSHHIFLIPVRLDETIPEDEELQNLNWVDLYPSYQKGINRILDVLDGLEKTPLELRENNQGGKRAPIHYTPYRNFSEFARDFVSKLPSASMYADPEYAIYITYETTHPDIEIPQSLKEQYPDKITIVLQNQFKDLEAGKEAVSVVLAFGGVGTKLVIPYSSIIDIAIPSIGARMQQIPV
ncbi:MAG: TIR domain-containing protein [Flavobacteriaceae bacterium]|nr:TIR domain-containing protein [Flavobacteriaceae bacterium]